MKSIHFIVVLFLIVACSESEKTCKIQGNLTNIEDGTYLYLRDLHSYELLDSFAVTNENFSYQITNNQGKPLILHNKRNLYSFRDRKVFWVDTCDIKISGDYNFIKNLEIENSFSQKILNRLHNEEDSLGRLMKLVGKEKSFTGFKPNDSSYKSIKEQVSKRLTKYPSNILNDYFTMHLLYPIDYFYSTQLSPDDILNIYNLLPTKLKNTKLDEKFNKSSILQPLPFVQKAIDIEQQTPAGDTVRLSDLKGKVVFVDFWASWCVPCRKSFVELKKVYRKYKTNGFEVYSVSWDDNKDAWINAIKNDSIPWINVSDLKGKRNKAFLDYNIEGVPTNFLVDKKGIIIMRGFRDFKVLDNELSEIFEKK